MILRDEAPSICQDASCASCTPQRTSFSVSSIATKGKNFFTGIEPVCPNLSLDTDHVDQDGSNCRSSTVSVDNLPSWLHLLLRRCTSSFSGPSPVKAGEHLHRDILSGHIFHDVLHLKAFITLIISHNMRDTVSSRIF